MLSSAATVIHGKNRELATPSQQVQEPKVTPMEDGEQESLARAMDRELRALLDGSARYVVTYDSRIIAMFAREDDAFLLESELADLDLAHGATSGCCQILDRRTWRRLGGYLLASGKLLTFTRDEDFERRFGGRRR